MYLNDDFPSVSSLLKYISHRILSSQLNTTIIIVSSEVSIPKEIENLVTVFEMDEIKSDDIEEYVRYYFRKCGLKKVASEIFRNL